MFSFVIVVDEGKRMFHSAVQRHREEQTGYVVVVSLQRDAEAIYFLQLRIIPSGFC